MRNFLNEPGHFYITDHLVALFYITVLLIWGNYKHRKLQYQLNIEGREYYFKGFVIKIFLSYAFALIYFFMYNGADSASYFQNAIIMNRLFFENPGGFIDLMIKPSISWEDYFKYFTSSTGYPQMSISLKANNHIVVKFATILAPLGMYNFFATSMLSGAIAYQFVFKAYRTFCLISPESKKFFSYAFLFFPSFVFWGAGIMKDTICAAAISQIVYAFYAVFIQKKRKNKLIFSILIAIYILLVTKPYLLFALIPGLVFWGAFGYVSSIKNKLVKFGLIPIFIILASIGSFYLLNQAIISSFGSTDQALERAVITQQDLIRSEQYGNNFYDIGRYDPSFTGLLSKTPIALTVGLFMPFVWQARNPVTILSALENLVLLFLTIYFLFRTRIYGLFVYTFRNPVLLFCISFSLITALIVGLTTANFGALVRYKMPLLPYFLSYFIILINLMNKKEETHT